MTVKFKNNTYSLLCLNKITMLYTIHIHTIYAAVQAKVHLKVHRRKKFCSVTKGINQNKIYNINYIEQAIKQLHVTLSEHLSFLIFCTHLMR